MFKSTLLSQLKHGFLTRRGGVSQGPFESLSFVVNRGDSLENVRRNREIALEKLGLAGKELITVNQVHGTEIIVVESPWGFNKGQTPDADVLITQNPDFVLGVFTADCVPILMSDEPSQTIAAVHSGWRGTSLNVASLAVAKMVELGARAETIKAAIGPCIAQDNYEVGQEVYRDFIRVSSHNARFFRPSANPEKYMFDLPGLVLNQLRESGVKDAEVMPLNTYQMQDEFFSCRRAFHKGEEGFGCMLSAISLTPVG
jgi:YfiH family protein